MFGITITNPSLLYFAALAALPVLVHLFFRRRFKKITWAAMEFLNLSNVKSRSIKRVEHLLLLSLRCLAIILFVLAFSRPLVKAPSHKGALGRSAAYSVIILDNSYSMGLKDINSTVFESAKVKALGIASLLEDGSGVSLITSGWKAKAVIKEPTYQLNVAKKEIESVALSDSPTDQLGALTIALELLRASTESIKEVYLVSDCQYSSFAGNEKEIMNVLKEISETANIYLVDVSAANQDNLALTSVKFSKDVVDRSFPVRIVGEVANYTGRNQPSVIVSLFVDGRNVESRSVAVAPGKTAQVSFTHRFLESGIHTGRLEIPPDLLEADNCAYFSLRVEERLKVLIVDGNPSKQSFHNESDYLNCAFMPFRGGGQESPPFFPEVTGKNTLGAADLSAFKTVILSNVRSLTAAENSRLEDYVKKGGGLVLFAGDSVDAADYNRLMYRERSGFLPARMSFWDDSQSKNDGLLIDRTGSSASGFEQLTVKELSRIKSGKAWKLEADADDPSVNVLAYFKNGSPAIVSKSFGKGAVVLLPFDASNKWSDLAIKPVFLPLLYELVYFTAKGGEDREKIIQTGNSITKLIPFNEALHTVSVIDPQKISHGVNTVMTSEGKLVRYPGTDTAGLYELKIGQTSDFFAVNLETGESNLKKAGKEYIYGISPERNFALIENGDDLKNIVSEKRKGAGVWKQLIFAVLLIMLAESALAARFGKRE